MNLMNRVALICGGARMGPAIADALAREGCHVVISFRSSLNQATSLVQSIRLKGVDALAVRADLTREKDIARLKSTILRRFRRLDVLVNLTSIYTPVKWNNANEKNWMENIDTNLNSLYRVARTMAPLIRVAGGRIIHVSDWLAASGRPRYKNFVPYYTSKTGVIGLTEALALELAPEVLVNTIAPGPIIPPIHSSKKEQNEVKNATPVGRWGGADEIAKAVLFLCESDFITGECIRVDGGRHLY